MVKVLTYDIPDHKIKLKIRQFQVMGKKKYKAVNNTGYDFDINSKKRLTDSSRMNCDQPVPKSRPSDFESYNHY